MRPVLARLRLLAPVLGAMAQGLQAQTAAPVLLLAPVWGTPPHCAAMLERANRGTDQLQADDYLAVAQLLEAGECVTRDEARAAQFYVLATRRGNVAASRHLAALFGAGRGVPQSYANAGAWLAGKGGTEERIEPWDYSIGVAYTLVAGALEQLRYPQAAWPMDLTLTLVIEADTQRPGKLGWRFTGEPVPQAAALAGPMGEAIDRAALKALERMAPVDPKYQVTARVSLPITVRREAADRFVVTEQDALLR
jgi:hypothetical protein